MNVAMIEISKWFSLATTGWASALLGQSAEPNRPIAEVNGWAIFDNRGTCAAVTTYESGATVAISYDFGNNTAWLYVENPAWESIQEGVRYPVTLRFSNDRSYNDARAIGVRQDSATGRVTGIRMQLLAEDFIVDFAVAAGMALRMGEVRVANYSLSGTRAVARRLSDCSIASHRRFPPDPFAGRGERAAGMTGDSQPMVVGAAPPQRARANLGSYFSQDDYPASALREAAQGTSRVSLTIGTNGRVVGCSIAASSGNASLDSATCRILQSRARYTPARDQSGNPATGVDRGSVTWVFPAN